MKHLELESASKIKERGFTYPSKNWKPIFSVVLVLGEDSLGEKTLLSLLHQSYYLFEIILIGKKIDKSISFAQSLFTEKNRIKGIKQENTSMRTIIERANKEKAKSSLYTLFINAGDLLDPTYLETSYLALKTQDKHWLYSDIVLLEDNSVWKDTFDWNKMFYKNPNLFGAIFDTVILNEWLAKEKSNDLYFYLYENNEYPIHISYHGYSANQLKPYIELQESQIEMITDMNQVIQFPRNCYFWEMVQTKIEDFVLPTRNKENKIHILMIIPWMVMGGADKFNLDLLKRIDKNKFEITLITTHPTGYIWRQQFEQTGIEIFDLSTFIDHKYWNYFLDVIIKTRNIDLVFNTNSTFGYASIPYIKEKYPTLPILDYIHMEEWYNRFGGYSRDNHVVHSLLDKTLFCNQGSEKILHEHFGVPKEQIETVYIGVDADKFDPEKYDKNNLKRQYKVAEDAFVIGYICRIATAKRPLLLVEIIESIKDKIPNVLFLIAGDGPLLEKMQEKVEQKELSTYIQFLGRVDKTEEFYKMCDMTINCSIKEGLALTTYESLSMGVPIVSSDVGGQKELISEEVGVIVPLLQEETTLYDKDYMDEEISLYVDAIVKIKENISSYSKNARKRIIKSFTLENMVSKMEKIFENTVHSPRKQAIENAIKLRANQNIYKEYINYYFLADSDHFQSLCNTYYKEFYMEPVIPLTAQEIADMKKNPFVFKMEQASIRFHCYHEFLVLEKMILSFFTFVASIFISFYTIIKNGTLALYHFIIGICKLIYLFLIRIGSLIKKVSPFKKR
ncbi:MAG: glycosyltransferase [Bacilli bacterium]|nr:glycosyltransferase [Bacilli bacterium]